jgi:hypothetical protein
MTLRGWNSFQYDSTGWSLTNFSRNAGAGQSGYASLRATAGQVASASYGVPSMTHIIVGFCWKHETAPNDARFFELGISSFIALQLFRGTGGSIYAKRNASTIIGTSTPGWLFANVETYVEVRVKMSTTVGEVEVRLNGNPTPVLNLTNVNTGSTDLDNILLLGEPTGARDFSAWYFIEKDATAPNDFLGHVRYGVLTMTGNGANSDMVGSDSNSTDNYLLVDDPALSHDSDTTYVQSPTVGDKDTYAVSDLPTPALSIIGVGTVVIARKTDAGSRAIKTVVRSGGADYQGTDEHFLSTSYAAYRSMFLQDPDGPATWDETAVNAIEAGVEVTT